MNIKTLSTIRYGIIAIIVGLALSQTAIKAQEVERSLVGVWMVTTTPQNCDTGATFAPFEAIYTFHGDGTLSVSIRVFAQTVSRSLFHGLWKKRHGWSDYSWKFVHIRWNTSTGAFLGKQEAGGPLELSESGDEFTSAGVNRVFDVDGNLIGGGCSTSVGTRFKLE